MKSFEEIIEYLDHYWNKFGCVLLQPYTAEVAAGTLHPATVIKAIQNETWRAAYLQPSIRPADCRFASNPNRLYQHHQYQVILKPSPENLQDLYIKSLAGLGIDPKENDIKFIKDDWKNPSIGAHGLGWEIRCNGMEISQFTYMQKIGGIDCIAGELAYGLERIAMHIQEVETIFDIKWNNKGTKYGDLFLENEKSFSAYAAEYADIEFLTSSFIGIQKACNILLEKDLPEAAYDQCLKACHILNLLESRKGLSTTEHASYMAKVRNMAKNCCYKALNKGNTNEQ